MLLTQSNNNLLSNLLDDNSNDSPHRPTSAPPDLEFSSTNVFAFGLKNYSSFRTNNSSYNNNNSNDFNNDNNMNHNNGIDGLSVSQINNPIRQPLVDDANLQHQWNSSPLSSPSSVSPSSLLARQSRLNQNSTPLIHRSLSDDSNNLSNQEFHSHQFRDFDSNSIHDQLAANSATLDALSSNGYDNINGFSYNSLSMNNQNNSMNNQMDMNNFYSNNGVNPMQQFTNAQIGALLQQQMVRLQSQASHGHNSSLGIDDKLLLLQLQQNQAMQAALMQQQFRAHQQSMGFNHSHRKFHSSYHRDGIFNNDRAANRNGQFRGGGNNHRVSRGGFHQNSNQNQNQNKSMRNFNPLFEPLDNQKFNNNFNIPLSPVQDFDTQSQQSTNSFLQNSQSNPAFPDEFGLSSLSLSTNDYQSQFNSSSTIEELTGNIYSLAKDQYGCRLLQRLIDEQKPRLCELIFNEIFDHINELMTDPFSNYLLQKLIEHCNEIQRLQFLTKCSSDLVGIALNMHGTRVVQKMVEMSATTKEIELLQLSLKNNVVTMCKDLNGNHVIQRCLHHLASKDNQFIYDSVSRHCVSVATHKHGCCVLQRCIDYATLQQKKQLINEIIANSLELVQDAFGNYVCQYILDLGDINNISGISQQLLGHVSSLSVQKFSSNVVEKCLELTNEKIKAKLIEELIQPERLPRLLNDPYSNYVIQKALTVAKRNQFERMVVLIKPHLASLNNTAFGKRISAKIMRKFPHISQNQNSSINNYGENEIMNMNESGAPSPTNSTLNQRHVAVGAPIQSSLDDSVYNENNYNVRPSLSGYAAALAGSNGLSNSDQISSMSPTGQLSYATALWKSNLQRAASEGNTRNSSPQIQ